MGPCSMRNTDVQLFSWETVISSWSKYISNLLATCLHLDNGVDNVIEKSCERSVTPILASYCEPKFTGMKV